MEQATQPATPAAPSVTRASDTDREEYQRASALMDRIVGQLTAPPRSAAVVGELIGFRVQLNFGTNDPDGVLEFAEIADTTIGSDHSGRGVWLEARTIIEGIPVRAEVLLSAEAAGAYEARTRRPNSTPDDTAAAPTSLPPAEPVIVPVQPAAVPLGDSAIGYALTVHTPAAGDEQ